jgi:hypothetical protein
MGDSIADVIKKNFVTGFQNGHVMFIGKKRMISIRQRPGHTRTLWKEI